MTSRKARRALRFHHRFLRWLEQHVVADDPMPEYSGLDRLAGLH